MKSMYKIKNKINIKKILIQDNFSRFYLLYELLHVYM